MLKIGFVGFGEVGYTFAKGIKDYTNGKCTLYAYDANQNNEWQGQLIQSRAANAGVTLAESISDLAQKADIIMGLIPSSISIRIAGELAGKLRVGQVYCDLSSASPTDKKRINSIIDNAGASFIDGAIMGSMLSYGFKAPIFVSGSSAEKIARELVEIGLNVRTAGEIPGAASTIKMLRASFTKGIEAIIFETFYAASVFNVEDTVLEILADTFDNESFRESVNRYLTSGAIHAKRRADEVIGVIGLLESIDAEPYMAQGTHKRLSWVAQMDLKEFYNGITPDDYHQVLDILKDRTGK